MGDAKHPLKGTFFYFLFLDKNNDVIAFWLFKIKPKFPVIGTGNFDFDYEIQTGAHKGRLSLRYRRDFRRIFFSVDSRIMRAEIHIARSASRAAFFPCHVTGTAIGSRIAYFEKFRPERLVSLPWRTKARHRAAVEDDATGTSELCALVPSPTAQVEKFLPRRARRRLNLKTPICELKPFLYNRKEECYQMP